MALVLKNLPNNGGDIKRHGFNPWVRKIPWRRAWQSTPVFLPGESHGQWSLAGYSPWDHKESNMTEPSNTFRHIYTHTVHYEFTDIKDIYYMIYRL